MGLKDLLTKTIYVTSPTDPDPHSHPRRFKKGREEMVRVVLGFLGSAKGWKLEGYHENQGRIRATHRSWVPPFVEDVNLYVIQGLDGITKLEATSQSRGGRGDWGQNKRNLRKLLAALDASGSVPRP